MGLAASMEVGLDLGRTTLGIANERAMEEKDGNGEADDCGPGVLGRDSESAVPLEDGSTKPGRDWPEVSGAWRAGWPSALAQAWRASSSC